ncbi:MAG: methyltransferase [Alphaproteobacteria bacterium]|nr:methyltransferase [Alphaproteobacteria bacterium]
MIAPEEFIRAHTNIASAPLVPEIQLCLANHITPLWQDLEAWLVQPNVDPPYWAFVWPGGQALTRYLLDHPEVVRGKRALDLASGCGISAIAMARGGASVDASETDRVAAAAIGLNAELNQVDVEVLVEDVTDRDNGAWGVIVAGDICYEKKMTAALFPWLQRAARGGATVLVADPGRDYLPRQGLAAITRYVVPTSLDLEKGERRETTVYRVT